MFIFPILEQWGVILTAGFLLLVFLLWVAQWIVTYFKEEQEGIEKAITIVGKIGGYVFYGLLTVLFVHFIILLLEEWFKLSL